MQFHSTYKIPLGRTSWLLKQLWHIHEPLEKFLHFSDNTTKQHLIHTRFEGLFGPQSQKFKIRQNIGMNLAGI